MFVANAARRQLI